MKQYLVTMESDGSITVTEQNIDPMNATATAVGNAVFPETLLDFIGGNVVDGYAQLTQEQRLVGVLTLLSTHLNTIVNWSLVDGTSGTIGA